MELGPEEAQKTRKPLCRLCLFVANSTAFLDNGAKAELCASEGRRKFCPMSDLNPVASWQDPAILEQFLQSVRGTVPLAIEQVEMMLQLVAAARGQRLENFLDLGCEQGVLSAALLDEYPNARGWLVDLSDELLRAARQRLHTRPRVDFVKADFGQAAWTGPISAGAPFDAIVSALSIHVLPDIRKRALYAEIFGLLKPDGIFINIEHVASATRWTQSVMDDYMIDAIFGQAIKAAPGKTRAEVAREYYAQAGTSTPAPLEVQCDWLREIGFENVDCYLKVNELALFGGQRGESKQ
jgi:ubiquinone/menaquinone biosynthesis C-methylase UbiE